MKSTILTHYILAFKTIYTASSLSSCIYFELMLQYRHLYITFSLYLIVKLIGDVLFLNLVSSDRGLKTRSCSDHSDQPVQPHRNLSFIYLFHDSVKLYSKRTVKRRWLVWVLSVGVWVEMPFYLTPVIFNLTLHNHILS